MGAWDHGIFDNDSAADFSGALEDCSDVEARHDLLMATMGAILEREIRPDEMTPDYEFGYEVEHALASAAYIADAKNGVHQFTDNPFAMGHDRTKADDDPAYWYHIDVGTPSPKMVERAVLVVEKILLDMVMREIDPDWREPSEKLYSALLKGA